MARRTIILIAIAFFCYRPSWANHTNLVLVNLVEGVYVEIPSGIRVEKSSPVDDFMLIDFIYSRTHILKAYIGNFPSFPSEACSGNLFENVVNGFQYKEVACRNDKLSMELLVDLGAEFQWPRFIHFMLPESDSCESVARKIIYSVSSD